jgi:hypothetical protein
LIICVTERAGEAPDGRLAQEIAQDGDPEHQPVERRAAAGNAPVRHR